MQLIHGDCLEEMKKIPDHSVDMILADLPYGTTACSWDIVIPFEPLWEQYKRIRKGKSAIVLFGSEPFSSLLRMSNFNEYKYDWVWDKIIGAGFQIAKYRPLMRHENILVFGMGTIMYQPIKTERIRPIIGYATPSLSSPLARHDKNERIYSDKHPTSIIEIKKLKNTIHPTQKPTALLEYLIKTYTNEGDLVLDNCMGSGSTGIACLNTNRDFIGIELYPLPDKPISKTNPDYFGIAKNRIAKWKFEPTEDSKDEQINLF